MSDISTITVNNITYDIKDTTARTQNATHHVYYVKGTQTAKTGAWTGNLPDISALYEGLIIDYWLPYDGDGNATLNLTIDNGTKTTGAINCYYQNTSRLTTHIPAYSVCQLIYQTVTINGTSYTGWYLLRCYDQNDTGMHIYRLGGYTVDRVVYRYQMLFQTGENTLTPLNTVNNTTAANKSLLTDVEFDPLGRIYYWNSTSTISANGTVSAWGAIRDATYFDLRYTFNCGTNLIANKALYLKVIPQINGMVKLASGDPLVYELPNTNDGFLYIYLGRTYSNYQLYLYNSHPVYFNDGTGIKEYRNLPISSAIKYSSGNIIHLTADEQYPLSTLKVGIEPQQDLHGYDNPWPAGSGKNLFPVNDSYSEPGGRTFVVNPDGSITANGTASSTVNLDLNAITLKAGSYIINGCPDGTTTSYMIQVTNANMTAELALIRSDNPSYTLTISEETTIHLRFRIIGGVTISNATIYPMIRLASISDSTYEPYSNICPINGHTSAVVTRTGKNLFDVTTTSVSDVHVTRSGDNRSLKMYSQNATGRFNRSTFTVMPAKSIYGKSITLSLRCSHYPENGNPYFYMAQVYENNTLARTDSWPGLTDGTMLTKTLTPVSDKGDIVVALYISQGNEVAIDDYSEFNDIQLELGNVKTDFVEPHSQQVTIDLDGTRYGGTVNMLTGEMTVTDVMITPTYEASKLAYIYGGVDYYPWIFVSTRGNYVSGMCNKLVLSTNLLDLSTKPCFIIRDSYIIFSPEGHAYTNNDDAVAAGTAFLQNQDVQFVYPLPQPQTVQLTPQQLSVLVGDSYIWSNTGDTEAGYSIVHPISQGGTGATTVAQALNNLGAAAANHTHNYLPLSGGEMLGQIKLGQAGFRSYSDDGFSMNEWGNLQHLSSSTSDYFRIKSYDGSNVLSINWETGEIAATGDFTIQKDSSAILNLQRTSITHGTAPLATTELGAYTIRESTGKIGGYLNNSYTTGKVSRTRLAARHEVNGSNVNNTLDLMVSSDGTRSISVSDPAIWRNELGAVNIAGDTMTGNLRIEKADSAALYLKTTNGPSESYICAYPDSSASSNGNNVVMKAGGNMIIGGGEFPGSAYNNNIDSCAENTERLYLGSDGAVYIYSNANTIANRKTWIFNNDGSMTLPAPLSIANGGTNATTAANARANFNLVPDYKSTTPSAVTVNKNSLTEIATLDLSVGYWIVSFAARFASNASGYRYMESGGITGIISAASSPAVNGDYTILTSTYPCHLSSATTVTLKVKHNNGPDTLNVTGRIYAVRVANF